MKVFGIILVLALIGGAVYLFSKSSKKEVSTSTTSTTTSNTGLSGLLAGLNLSGLSLSLA